LKQVKHKATKSKVPLVTIPEHIVEPTPEPTHEDLEFSEAIALQEHLHIASLTKECRALRQELDLCLNTYLLESKIVPLRGNSRQRQLREMSWTFLSLKKALPKGFPLLPCASSGSEVYQMTHFINACLLTLCQAEQWQYIENEALTTLVEQGRDELEQLEAKKVLYSYLLALLPHLRLSAEPSALETRAHVTLTQVYELLLEVRELIVAIGKGEQDAKTTERKVKRLK